MTLTAIYDASVLQGSAARLMHLALTGLFRAGWSASVHEAWMTTLLRNRPDLSCEKLERTRTLMDKHAGDALPIKATDPLSRFYCTGSQPSSPPVRANAEIIG